MNLMIIGRDTDDVALMVWRGNTNFTVLNKCPCVFDKRFIDFIKNKETIVSTTPDQFVDVPINKFIEFMKTYKFIPIFMTTEEDTAIKLMHTAITDFIKESVLYTKNKEEKDFNEFIELCKKYLNLKGYIEDENKTVRAPRKRKTSSTKK